MIVNELIAELQVLAAQGHGDVRVAIEMWDERVISYQDVSPEFIKDATVIVDSKSPSLKLDVVLIS